MWSEAGLRRYRLFRTFAFEIGETSDTQSLSSQGQSEANRCPASPGRPVSEGKCQDAALMPCQCHQFPLVIDHRFLTCDNNYHQFLPSAFLEKKGSYSHCTLSSCVAYIIPNLCVENVQTCGLAALSLPANPLASLRCDPGGGVPLKDGNNIPNKSSHTHTHTIRKSYTNRSVASCHQSHPHRNKQVKLSNICSFIPFLFY